MYERIPEELRRLPQWVNFILTEKPGKPGKLNKQPINPRTGEFARSNDPGTWASFDEALANLPNAAGLGFMFAADHAYFGVDLDGCEDAIADWRAGKADNIVGEFIESLASYAEYSVSGNGIHIICRGVLPDGGRRRGDVEMYGDGRFFAMTGNIASGYTTITDGTDSIRALHEKYIQTGKVPTVYTQLSINDAGTPDMDEVIRLAEASKQGNMFRELMAGNWEAFYSSQSEADIAFCNMLAFWARRDERLMDQIFRASGLMREKWDRRQSGSTYGAITIAKAARECTSVYERRKAYKVSASEGLTTVEEPRRAPDFNRYTLDDVGAATRMADMFGPVLRYCYPEHSFYYFDSRRWVRDNTGAVYRMADDTATAIREDCEEYVDACGNNRDPEECRKEYMKFVKRCRSNNARKAIVNELQPRVSVLPEEFDTHKDLLNTPSGVVNLRTGELTPHDPRLMITRVTVAEYTNKTDCPRWEQFLWDIFGGDRDLIRYVQRAVGYSMTASTAEQMIFFAVGDGSNGKSTFFETLAGCMGDYATNAQPQTFLAKAHSNAISSDLARLKGARMVTVSEPEEGARLDEGLVKQLTGGDRVTARKLYAEEMEFSPEFKIWFATNHRPIIRGTDHGIWRRLCIIPFAVKIPADKIDRSLRWKLMREYPGILAWAVEGALAWQREGLGPTPECVRSAVADYRNEMDVFTAFLNECTQPSGEVSSGDLYRAYVDWARDSNEYVMSATKFGRECGKRFECKRSNQVRKVIEGVSLMPAMQPYRVTLGKPW